MLTFEYVAPRTHLGQPVEPTTQQANAWLTIVRSCRALGMYKVINNEKLTGLETVLAYIKYLHDNQR